MRRGFTAIELAIVITVTAVLVPATYLFWRSMHSSYDESIAFLRISDETRAFSEELRRDRMLMRWADPSALAMTGDGACRRVEYRLEERALVRTGDGECGVRRAVATNVMSATRTAWGVELVFLAPSMKPEMRSVVMRVALGGNE